MSSDPPLTKTELRRLDGSHREHSAETSSFSIDSRLRSDLLNLDGPMIMCDGIGRHPSRWGVNTRNSLNEMRGRPPRCSFSLGNTGCPPPLQALRRRVRDAPRVAPIKALLHRSATALPWCNLNAVEGGHYSDRRQTYLLRRTSIAFPIMRGQRLFGRSSRDSTQFRLLALLVCFHSRRPPTDMSSKFVSI